MKEREKNIRPKIEIAPANTRGRPLIRPHNVRELEKTAATGDISGLKSLGKALQAKMLSDARREAIEKAVADLIAQVKQGSSERLKTGRSHRDNMREVSTPGLRSIAEEEKPSSKDATEDSDPRRPRAAITPVGRGQLDYRMSFLLGPEFRGRYREQLTEISGQIPLQLVRDFLYNDVAPLNLTTVVNTPVRRLRLEEAIKRFESAIQQWREGKQQDPRVTWIAPWTDSNVTLAHRLNEINDIFEQIGQIKESVQRYAPEIAVWLPWMSMELVHTIRNMRATETGALRRSLIKMGRYFGKPDEVQPWTSSFDGRLAELPIHSLYQFEPTSELLKTLTRLASVHCSNVGHLVAFHPEALQTIRTVQPRVWPRLALSLNDLSQ